MALSPLIGQTHKVDAFMIHSSSTPRSARRESTRARVQGRDPELVPVDLIRLTEIITLADCRGVGYSPICLVKDGMGLFYIVDGNHRFLRKIHRQGELKKILAWVLQDGDQERIEGERISMSLSQWKAGQITLAQLVRDAQVEADRVIQSTR
jgi:hypothetical protein